MANLKIALLQIASCGMDQRANLLKGEDCCRLDSVAKGVKIGALILQADEQEGVHLAEFDLEKPRSWRQKEAVRKGRTFHAGCA